MTDRQKARVVARLWAFGDLVNAMILARHYDMRVMFWEKP